MYLGQWNDFSDVRKDFDIHIENPGVIFAAYSLDGYEGNAFVLYSSGDKLYEVNGSHCSCYGLEGQWDPEETSIQALRIRMSSGTLGAFYWDNYQDELARVLDSLEESSS